MTIDITLDFIKKHSLMECLEKFSGAQSTNNEEKEKELNKVFELLAKKMIYGGYFEVYCKGTVKHRIYIQNVEFYYHEEIKDGFKDWIVYHRNPQKGKGKEKPAFPLGSLHLHVSGIDITFEDQQKEAKDVKYRASALIREFIVTNGNREIWDNDNTDIHPTHLYEQLFSQASFEEVKIKWHPVVFTDQKVIKRPRINVYEYDSSGKRLKDSSGKRLKDFKEWSFSREKKILLEKK